MADRITPGKKGVAELSVFEVSNADAEFSKLRMVVTGGREQAVPAGKYAKLQVHGQLMMTDTPMEQRTNETLIRRAKGEVLIAGLGVGMVLEPLLKKAEVTSILVVEKFQDVIDLVSPSFKEAIEDERLHVLCEDVFEFRPLDDWLWDTVYFDIWPTVCEDNLAEMERLHNMFRFHLASSGWMSSWEYNRLRGQRDRRNGIDEDDLFEDEDDDE